MNLVADVVANAMNKGLLKRDDVWEVAFTVTAHTHGYISLYLGGRIASDHEEFRAVVRRSLGRLLHGFKD